MFLSAVFYKERDKYPFRFILALILLCMSCAYGMVIAVGIVIVWFFEIIKEDNFHIKSFFLDKRFKSILLIFFVCLFLTIIMIPYKDTYAVSSSIAHDYKLKFLYSFFILPCDALFYNFLDIKRMDLFNLDLSEFLKIFNKANWGILSSFWSGCFLGIIVNVVLFIIFKKLNKLLLFYVPYLMFLAFSVVYIGPHHIGLLTIYIVTIFWCVLQDSQILKKEMNVLYIGIAICIAIQVYWGICAISNEIKYDYWASRTIANYIKQNNLDRYKIMSNWYYGGVVYVNKKTKRLYLGKRLLSDSEYAHFINNFEQKRIEYLNMQSDAVCINQYFDKNIFLNFSNENNKPYILLKKLSDDENNKLGEEWRRQGVPEIAIGNINLNRIYDAQTLSKYQYIPLKNFSFHNLWKDKVNGNIRRIYIRKDIYDRDFLFDKKD